MRAALAIASALSALGVAAPAAAQVAELAPRTSIFIEPSKTSKLTVINPSADLRVMPTDWLEVHAAYAADIVSGATESLKGGRLSPVDIVSSATKFHDTRHQVSGGFGLTRENTKLSATYSYGTESDYRSHSFSIQSGTSFLQKNTELTMAYGRGFDHVCTTGFVASDSASVRQPLDSSTGCFTKAVDRASRKVDLDNFQAGWTQSWTPLFATQLVLYGALQHGFLENPYRAVVIAPAGDQALENHPDNRLRLAAAVRARYYLRPIKLALSAGARLYRDTWDILGQTYELEAERYVLPEVRVLVRGRYYTQTEALFWSDDYTGGEPKDGPRGQYWTGDRELSPLSSYSLGGRMLFKRNAEPNHRIAFVMLSFETSVSLDIMKTHLREFTWGGVTPDDTLAGILSIGVRGTF
ncbi:MAG TPA: DUF3570 domain-containing protein [Polyangiaceae bacterium]|nr:DUF3570 domain-containing protein [Polyangiaceae bacterium]